MQLSNRKSITLPHNAQTIIVATYTAIPGNGIDENTKIQLELGHITLTATSMDSQVLETTFMNKTDLIYRTIPAILK
jgi:hypothetical protein